MYVEAQMLLDKTLASLKDFQLATVNAVLHSYKKSGSNRILVADEVGLGKTIVAKGVIAELLKEKLLQENYQNKPLLRVTYICSNLTLANENRKKLSVFNGAAQEKYVQEPSYSRLLEIAVVDQQPGKVNKVLEVCSLTPTTSFTLTRGHGNWYERLIIYFALTHNIELNKHQRKVSKFFSNNVNRWKEAKNSFKENKELDENIVDAFLKMLSDEVSQVDKDFCHIERVTGSWFDYLLMYCQGELNFNHEIRVRACIRTLLARACAKHLTSDLFILDEFQRFKMLLDSKDGNDESLVAREIFNHKRKAKILLLSATPFKAISQVEDDEKGNAHAEELSYLLRFISNSDQDMLDEYEKNRHAVQQQILSLRDMSISVSSLSDKYKNAIENNLKKYICRTERVQISENYEGLFEESNGECLNEFSNKDIDSFRAIDHLGEALQKVSHGRHHGQLMEFYKASPWPLSFLSGYQFKKQLDNYRQNGVIKGPLSRSDAAWLSRTAIQKYQISLTNAPLAKIRALVKKIFEGASEELLWVPPSFPHYPLQGSFENQGDFSKTLLFSSWAMVPRALSGLISYEAERRLLLNRKGVKKEYYKKATHSSKIKFDGKASLAGWSLVYPSKIMLDMPLSCNTSSFNELLKERTVKFEQRLENLKKHQGGSNAGQRWYALSPMLLDMDAGYDKYVKDWLYNVLESANRDNETYGRKEHLKQLTDYIISDEILSLGPIPQDLAEYLAVLSIAGPAVAISRTLKRNWPGESTLDIAAVASDAAFSVVAMFNKIEAERILDKHRRHPKYFYAIVQYCAEGGFQAVIDEYGHLLKDAGMSMEETTEHLTNVMGIRTSSVACQFREDKRKTSQRTTGKTDKDGQVENKHSLRCHYAVPLGNQKTSDEKGVQRVSSVRDAFNSPFRPFMLNSTSIGQEGLDFHWYCHRVVHWHLPGNPIDIEQREGRVNRYKSLVVRKRVAQQYRQYVNQNGHDPWVQLFQKADEITKENGRTSDLIPFWHIPEGDAKIERFVPMMPMSKDVTRFTNALEILSLYRLAFGQPRQEELLDNLLKRNFTTEEIEIIKKALVINLSPLIHSKSQ